MVFCLSFHFHLDIFHFGWALGSEHEEHFGSASPVSILEYCRVPPVTAQSGNTSAAPRERPVWGNSVIGLQIPGTHTEDNMQQNKEERNSSSRVCETIVRHRQWKTNIRSKGKFESPICSTLCADKRQGSAGNLATTEYSKHKLRARVGH